MFEETRELQQAAARSRAAAQAMRRRAAMVLPMLDLDWHGPGSSAYVAQASARWQALVAIADQLEALSETLDDLAGLSEAA